MGRIFYWQKISKFNMACMFLDISYHAYREELHWETQEILDTYPDMPDIKVRVDIILDKGERPYIDRWYMDKIDDERLVLFRDDIANAIDGYIYGHEDEIVLSEDKIVLSELASKEKSHD